MDKQNENIIKAITTQTFDDNKPFGQVMDRLLFPKNKRALLCIEGHYVLLLTNDVDATTDIKILIELLSYLRYMENEHIIYVQNGENLNEDYILYEGCDDMKKSSTLQGYDLGSGYELKVDQRSGYIVLNNEKKILTQNVDIDFLRDEIKKYFESRIFSTSAVNKLIDHNYLSENDYNNQQALKLSRRSILVALAIACLSPFVTLFLSNKWGKATINNTQYEGILMKIGESATLTDTTASVIQDTQSIFQEKVIENEQDSIKPL